MGLGQALSTRTLTLQTVPTLPTPWAGLTRPSRGQRGEAERVALDGRLKGGHGVDGNFSDEDEPDGSDCANNTSAQGCGHRDAVHGREGGSVILLPLVAAVVLVWWKLG